MICLRNLLCATFLITLPHNSSAETHEAVQAALDWELPLNSCKKPRSTGQEEGVVAHGGVISHAPTGTTEGSLSTPTVFGIDHYKIDQYERKKKRWETCVTNYKSNLLDQFEVMKSSAQYGLTEQQAETILGKFAQIQAAVLSPKVLPRWKIDTIRKSSEENQN
jgi:hypothetical protein